MAENQKCPFCFSDKLRVKNTGVTVWRVQCTQCGCWGPPAYGKDEAIFMWNNRAPANLNDIEVNP